MTTRRPPGGRYRGGLAGPGADPTVGIRHAAGPGMHEDWLREGTSNADFGDHRWTRRTIGGAGATVAVVSPKQATDLGVLMIEVDQQANRGAAVNLRTTESVYLPPIGALWAAKVSLNRTANIEVWAGFSDHLNGRVRSVDPHTLLGIRYDAAGLGQWEGVCKTGAGANAETTVTLGAATAGDTEWLRAGWEAVDTDGSGTLGIQFFTLDCSSRAQMFRSNVGNPIVTNIPTPTGPCGLGMFASSTALTQAFGDYWSFGGRTAR